jgi:arabinofuranan 3-O-arabinosyltransferase
VARELRLTRGVTVAVVLAVLASSPLHGTLVLGQIYPLLLVGLVAGWVAERRGHPLLAAALYGATVALKPSLVPLLLLPVAVRRWRPAATGWGAAAAASLLGVLVAGPASGLEWLRIGLTEPVPDTADNASLPGLAVRFGLPGAVGTAVGLAVLGGTLLTLARRRARVDPAGTAPWAVLAAGLLLSPIAWHNYLMLLWPGALVLLARDARAAHRTPYRPGRAAVLLAVAVVPVSWNALWPPEAWWSLPGRSLYGAILLSYWWVLLSSSSSRRCREPSDGRSRAVSDRGTPSRSLGGSSLDTSSLGASSTTDGLSSASAVRRGSSTVSSGPSDRGRTADGSSSA